MSALFGGNDYPDVPKTPAVPTVATTAGEGDVAARELAKRLQRGRSATQLTGGSGLADTGSTSKALLGQ
jgi:hypothetical protein